MTISKRVRSNVARNLRRQVDRRIAQAKKIIATTKSKVLQQAYANKLEKLREAKEATYLTSKNDAGKRVLKTDKEIRSSLQKASQELVQSRYLTERGRRNLVSTQAQINAASVKAESMYTQAETRIFFRATQNAWQRPGISVKERIPAILEYYGYENLSELMADVLTLNQKAVELSKIENVEEMTEEQMAIAEESDVQEAQQSPQYLSEVISMPEPSGVETLEKAQ